MLNRLVRFFEKLNAAQDTSVLEQDEEQLAVAALLVNLINIDGMAETSEQTLLKSALARNYGFDEAQLAQLLSAAREKEENAVDLYRFTSVLKRRLDAAGRIRVIEMMWQIAYADGRLDALEDNAVWRVAELLGVSTQDRMAMRRAVASGPSRADDAPAGKRERG